MQRHPSPKCKAAQGMYMACTAEAPLACCCLQQGNNHALMGVPGQLWQQSCSWYVAVLAHAGTYSRMNRALLGSAIVYTAQCLQRKGADCRLPYQCMPYPLARGKLVFFRSSNQRRRTVRHNSVAYVRIQTDPGNQVKASCAP
jgi:hypothetical protein